jgi:hypothetical protein
MAKVLTPRHWSKGAERSDGGLRLPLAKIDFSLVPLTFCPRFKIGPRRSEDEHGRRRAYDSPQDSTRVQRTGTLRVCMVVSYTNHHR